MRNQKGITLIALVVTIIVLLILAGVSIAMLTGENGIMRKATESNWKSKLGDAEDVIALEVSSKLADYYALAYADGNAAEGDEKLDTASGAITAGCANAVKSLNGGATDGDYKVEFTPDNSKTDGEGKIAVTYKGKYEVTGTIGEGSSRVNWSKMTEKATTTPTSPEESSSNT